MKQVLDSVKLGHYYPAHLSIEQTLLTEQAAAEREKVDIYFSTLDSAFKAKPRYQAVANWEEMHRYRKNQKAVGAGYPIWILMNELT